MDFCYKLGAHQQEITKERKDSGVTVGQKLSVSHRKDAV